MDLIKLPSILTRWWYVFALIVGAALIGFATRLATTPPTYDATVAIQVSAPSADNVQVLGSGPGSSSSLRDDLLLVSNDFTFVAQSPEVRNLTIGRLKLRAPDTNYTVTVKPVTDSSYLNLTVQARTPELAQAIANTQAQEAIQYYGELRAKPATTTAELLNNQLQASAATIASLQNSIPATNGATSTTSGTSSTSVALTQAVSNYSTLLEKRSEALLAAQDASHVSYIQVVNSAPETTTASWLKTAGITLVLTLIGSLGLSTLIALLLEARFQARANRRARLRNRVTSMPSRGEKATSDLAMTTETSDNFPGKSLRSGEAL